MAGLVPVLVAIATIVAWYGYSKLVYLRFKQFQSTNVPMPESSLILGHLKLIGQEVAKGDNQRHSDYCFESIAKSLGSPPILLLDLRPVTYPICLIMSHEVAEQVSKPTQVLKYSTPKSETVKELVSLIGDHSIVVAEGEDWKTLRKRFNPGFAPQHLHTLLPKIIEKTKIFTGLLDGLAQSGAIFSFDELCTNLTFDIIAAVTMDEDFHAQLDKSKRTVLVRHFVELLAMYAVSAGQFKQFFTPLRTYRRRQVSKIVDVETKKIIRTRFEEMKAAEKANQPITGRSVISLSLKDLDELTPDILQTAADQIKTFLFAGHDTTSTTLQWAFYELSRRPKVLETMRAEHDRVFGTDPTPEAIEKVLMERGESALTDLSYTAAVFKETLRLYPPASTARMLPKGSNVPVKLPDGEEFVLEKVILYSMHYMIQRDPKVFGETADDFIPERWLGNTSTTEQEFAKGQHNASGIPATAWRPFERGPRNCIGQELVNIEAKVIMVFAVRRFDFTKTGLGSPVVKNGEFVLNEKGHYEVTNPLYNRRQITARPIDGTTMTVKHHKKD